MWLFEEDEDFCSFDEDDCSLEDKAEDCCPVDVDLTVWLEEDFVCSFFEKEVVKYPPVEAVRLAGISRGSDEPT